MNIRSIQAREVLDSRGNPTVVAHGNSLRALVTYLEDMSHEKLGELEFGTGEVYCYQVDASGKIVHKEIRAANPDKLHV